MYEEHFALSRRPFAATAEPVSYYPASAIEEAYRSLHQAACGQEGLALVTAEPGMGKTLLARRIAGQLEPGNQVLYLANSRLADIRSFYQALLYDLGLPREGKTEQELRLAFLDNALDTFRQGRPTLIIIDDAHHLLPLHLEELRALDNLEAGQAKVVQTFLLGQPLLEETLKLPWLSSLAQRIRVKAALVPMDVHEAVDYLVHLLRSAGGRPERISTDEALEALARGGRGVPRLLNNAAHRAFQLACCAGETAVDAEAAVEALQELGLSLAEAEAPAVASSLRQSA
jgi:type II secretory pathway predicted ATPase ExeA